MTRTTLQQQQYHNKFSDILWYMWEKFSFRCDPRVVKAQSATPGRLVATLAGISLVINRRAGLLMQGAECLGFEYDV